MDDEQAPDARAGTTPTRVGRAPATSPSDLAHVGLGLILERGFDRVTVDEIAQAAGIGRRTFFRYFASKNDLPWGDFDALLDHMRAHLAAIPDTTPLGDALRDAVVEFNRYPEAELVFHRQRMSILLRTPTLVAHSTLRYESWREVVADFVAARLGVASSSLPAQTIAWTCLGVTLAAYEQWLVDESASLTDVIAQAFDEVGAVFAAPPGV